jgi:hypothetical protein
MVKTLRADRGVWQSSDANSAVGKALGKMHTPKQLVPPRNQIQPSGWSVAVGQLWHPRCGTHSTCHHRCTVQAAALEHQDTVAMCLGTHNRTCTAISQQYNARIPKPCHKPSNTSSMCSLWATCRNLISPYEEITRAGLLCSYRPAPTRPELAPVVWARALCHPAFGLGATEAAAQPLA